MSGAVPDASGSEVQQKEEGCKCTTYEENFFRVCHAFLFFGFTPFLTRCLCVTVLVCVQPGVCRNCYHPKENHADGKCSAVSIFTVSVPRKPAMFALSFRGKKKIEARVESKDGTPEHSAIVVREIDEGAKQTKPEAASGKEKPAEEEHSAPAEEPHAEERPQESAPKEHHDEEHPSEEKPGEEEHEPEEHADEQPAEEPSAEEPKEPASEEHPAEEPAPVAKPVEEHAEEPAAEEHEPEEQPADEKPAPEESAPEEHPEEPAHEEQPAEEHPEEPVPEEEPVAEEHPEEPTPEEKPVEEEHEPEERAYEQAEQAAEEPAPEEHSEEEPAPEEHAEEPATEEHTDEQPAEEPATEEQVNEESAPEEHTDEQPVEEHPEEKTEEPVAEEHSEGEATPEEQPKEEPAAEESPEEKPEEHADEQPSEEQPKEEPAAEEQANESAPEEHADEQPAEEQPADEQPPEEPAAEENQEEKPEEQPVEEQPSEEPAGEEHEEPPRDATPSEDGAKACVAAAAVVAAQETPKRKHKHKSSKAENESDGKKHKKSKKSKKHHSEEKEKEEPEAAKPEENAPDTKGEEQVQRYAMPTAPPRTPTHTPRSSTSSSVDLLESGDDDGRDRRTAAHLKTLSMAGTSPRKPALAEPQMGETPAMALGLLRQSPPALLEWLLTVHHTDALIQCHLNRERRDEYVYFTFVLDELTMPLMLVRKRAKNSAHAALTLPADTRVEHPLYLLRHNRHATEFALQHADKSKTGDLAAVRYMLGDTDDVPRALTILLPTDECRARGDLVNLLKCYHTRREQDKYAVYQNKAPVWREEMKSNVLNFGGRVKVSSTKNFQMVAPDNVADILMQFGRVTQNSFILDFKAPLCPLQALAVALSSFN